MILKKKKPIPFDQKKKNGCVFCLRVRKLTKKKKISRYRCRYCLAEHMRSVGDRMKHREKE